LNRLFDSAVTFTPASPKRKKPSYNAPVCIAALVSYAPLQAKLALRKQLCLSRRTHSLRTSAKVKHALHRF
jgi:hypothetical protein